MLRDADEIAGMNGNNKGLAGVEMSLSGLIFSIMA